MPATDWPELLLDQTRVPSASRRTKLPLNVSSRVAFSLTGRSRLAAQTTCAIPFSVKVIPAPLLVWTMNTAKRNTRQGGAQKNPAAKEGP
uniref:Uncharacterized protein n=1 Tax=Oryza brachyantha TaxID=4533 RepID=J3LWL6_ORYBR